MTQKDILHIAVRQSAIDLNCSPEDLLGGENRVVISRPHPDARRYLSLPFSLNLVSYGGGIVASVSEELAPIAREYISKYPAEHCFETPHIHALEAALRPYGQSLCFMAEYFLPKLEAMEPQSCPYELRILQRGEFEDLYLPQWSNALCQKRRHLDMLAVGAYDGETLVGLAGASADCETMWQIGVDVLPQYRRRGIAAALTARLAHEVLERGKVPFYCAAWSNLASVRNAIRCGFRPAWTELTAKSGEYVSQMNE